MSKFSVKKPLTVFVAVVLVLVLGVVSFTEMTPDLFPNLDLPYVLLMTTYPGASPEVVETAVSKPLEQSLATISNVSNMRSTSSANYSTVILEFADGTNMDTATIDIREKIDMVKAAMPDGVGSTYMMKINPNIMPVAVVAVDVDGKDTTELSSFVEDELLNKLEGISGVASVSSMGIIKQNINVIISQEKLDKVNKTIQDALNGKFKDAEDKLSDGQSQLQDGLSQAENGKNQIESGIEQLEEKQAEVSQQLAQANSALDEKQKTVLETKLALLQKQSELTQQRQIMQALYDTLVTLQNEITELESKKAELEEKIDNLEPLYAEYVQAMSDISTAVVGSDAYQKLTAQLDLIDTKLVEYGFKKEKLSDKLRDAKESLQQVEDSLNGCAEKLAEAGAAKDTLPNTIDELKSGLQQLDEGMKKISDTLAQLESGEVQISEAKKALDQQQTNAAFEMNSTYTQLVSKQSTVEATIKELETAKEELETAVDELADQKQAALDAADVNNVITMDMVSNILTAQNFSMPAGYVTEDGVEYLVRVGDKIEDVDELSQMLLFDMGIDGVEPIYLNDVADVFETDNSDEVFAKINGNNGVVMSFTKQSDYATAEVSDNINAKFKELSNEYDGLHFTSLMDQGDYIHLIINGVLENLLFGAILAIIILFFFLKDIKPTAIIAVSIPISLVFAVILMYFSGITLNVISLSGLAVGVGMLVDNSVVVIENIFRLRSKGATAIQAAVSGAKQVAGAITASTLTTVCVFLPIVFVEGITRQIFTDMALTIAYSLLASLIIALTLVPAMASKMFVKNKEKSHKLFDKFVALYERSLKFVLSHKAVALIVAVALLAGSMIAAISKGFSFMPQVSGTEITITAEMPDENSFEDTTNTADDILDILYGYDEFETVGGMIGSSTALVGLSSGSSDTSSVTFYCVLDESKSIDTAALSSDIENALKDINAEITVSGSGAMDSLSVIMGSGISIRVYNDDLEQLQKAATEITEKISQVDGVINAESGIEETTPEIKITVDKKKATLKGLTVAQVYQQISADIASEKTATSLTNEDGSSMDVVVVKDNSDDYSLDDIKNIELTYTEKDGTESVEKTVKLKDIASVEDAQSLSSVGRYNQRRFLTVSAEIAEGYTTTNVSNDVEKVVNDYELPTGTTIEFSGENESTMESVFELMKMLGLAVIFIYLIMVAQFQSFKSPFIVMFTIPLAFTGGFLGLVITGFDISIVSLIGFIMLCGIIVNNGIVLVDYINQLRLDGVEKRKALVEAGKTRIRPILMTSLTTVLGLSVMALGRGSGAALMQPLAIVCIGGLLYATVMTLYIVPVMYDIFNRKEMKKVSDSELEEIEE